MIRFPEGYNNLENVEKKKKLNRWGKKKGKEKKIFIRTMRWLVKTVQCLDTFFVDEQLFICSQL